MKDRHIYRQDGNGFESAEGQVYMAYSGHGEGVNNPDKQEIHDVGPLPRGEYTVGTIEDLLNTRGFGPGFIRLIPALENKMFGRAGFLIHWDTPAHDHGASHGCIVMINGANIAAIANSRVKLLEVV